MQTWSDAAAIPVRGTGERHVLGLWERDAEKCDPRYDKGEERVAVAGTEARESIEGVQIEVSCQTGEL